MRDEPDLARIARILACWGIRPVGVEPVRAAYKIVAEDRTVALKRAGGDEDRLRVVHEAFQYLHFRGFDLTAPFLPTRDGEPFLHRGRELWVVTPWREGREPEYGRPGELARCAVTLAEFHVAGLSFKPMRGRLRSSLGRRLEQVRGRVDELRSFLERAQAGERPDEFEGILREIGPDLLRQAERACRNLARTNYGERSDWARRALPLCHGDASNRNFILGPDGTACLIDLDSIRTDLPELDLCRLLRRTLRRVSWDFGIARGMLDAYSTRSPFALAGRTLILATLHFPDKAWRLLKQYYRPDDGRRRSRASVRLAASLRRVKADFPAQHRFLREYAKTYGITGFCWD